MTAPRMPYALPSLFDAYGALVRLERMERSWLLLVLPPYFENGIRRALAIVRDIYEEQARRTKESSR